MTKNELPWHFGQEQSVVSVLMLYLFSVLSVKEKFFQTMMI